MSWIPDRYRELRSLLRPERIEDDVAEELELHLELRVADLVARAGAGARLHYRCDPHAGSRRWRDDGDLHDARCDRAASAAISGAGAAGADHARSATRAGGTGVAELRGELRLLR